jgi:cytochrome P450
MANEPNSILGQSITEAALDIDPYPAYTRLREEEPVCWAPNLRLWLVTRWADVEYVCKHPQIFSAEIPGSPLTRTIGANMLHSDGDYHAHLRGIIEPIFRFRGIQHYPENVIEPIARELVETFAGQGAADLVSDYAHLISVRVLRYTLGIPVSDETLLRWSDGIAAGAANFTGSHERQSQADAANRGIDQHLTNLLDHPSDIPKDTALFALQSVEANHKMTREQILSTVKLLIIGGLKTSGDLISVSLCSLLLHPDQLNEILANPALIDFAVEEALRWLSPVGTASRRTTNECELSGVRLPAGAMIAGVLAAANRDPSVFTDPDRFDIHRREGGHLAFASGPHACVGALLGRYEGQVALRVLFETIRDLRLDPEKPVKVRGWEFRAPLSLNVKFSS